MSKELSDYIEAYDALRHAALTVCRLADPNEFVGDIMVEIDQLRTTVKAFPPPPSFPAAWHIPPADDLHTARTCLSLVCGADLDPLYEGIAAHCLMIHSPWTINQLWSTLELYEALASQRQDLNKEN